MENLKINLEEYYFVWVQPICKKEGIKKTTALHIYHIKHVTA